MRVYTVERPYIITFDRPPYRRDRGSGSYPLTSAEAQEIIDREPIVKATRNRVVVLTMDNHRAVIRPATAGGGPAFRVER